MISLKAHVWFPTLIWQADLPDDELHKLSGIREYVLNIKEKEPDGVKKTNYGGWQSKTFTQFPKEFKHISDKLEETIEMCRQQTLTDSCVDKLKLQSFWCNVNSYGDYNTLHNHRGSIFSGVFYVDVPDENMGSINFQRSDDIQYFLPPLKTYNNFSGEKATYKPQTGRVLIFPSWLRHSVDGCRSEQQRISIAFNYGV